MLDLWMLVFGMLGAIVVVAAVAVAIRTTIGTAAVAVPVVRLLDVGLRRCDLRLRRNGGSRVAIAVAVAIAALVVVAIVVVAVVVVVPIVGATIVVVMAVLAVSIAVVPVAVAVVAVPIAVVPVPVAVPVAIAAVVAVSAAAVPSLISESGRSGDGGCGQDGHAKSTHGFHLRKV